MSDERKPVICPWCGSKMKPDDVQQLQVLRAVRALRLQGCVPAGGGDLQSAGGQNLRMDQDALRLLRGKARAGDPRGNLRAG